MYLEQKLDFIIKELNKLREENQELKEIIEGDLTTRAAVRKYLNISQPTMQKYLASGVFIQDTHFYIDGEDRMVFIPRAIRELKANGFKPKRQQTQSDIASSVLKNMGVKIA